MVYNPPVEVGEDGEPIKDGGVALTHPVNPMRRGAYVEQATRATGWAVMYVLGWLLMRLSCYAGLPDDCNTPSEPLEVLTVLLVLLVFSLAQVSERGMWWFGGWFARRRQRRHRRVVVSVTSGLCVRRVHKQKLRFLVIRVLLDFGSKVRFAKFLRLVPAVATQGPDETHKAKPRMVTLATAVGVPCAASSTAEHARQPSNPVGYRGKSVWNRLHTDRTRGVCSIFLDFSFVRGQAHFFVSLFGRQGLEPRARPPESRKRVAFPFLPAGLVLCLLRIVDVQYLSRLLSS